jgi:hypothetical protein
MEPNKDEIIIKYFVLPMFKLSFAPLAKIYIAGYINREGTHLFVNLSVNDFSFEFNNLYDGNFVLNNTSLYMFETDSVLIPDMRLLIKGKYSKMSDLAKDRIRQYSGLAYKSYDSLTNTETSSTPLMALYKDPIYKQKLEMSLGIHLPDSAELYDKLTENVFIETLLDV